MARSHGWPAARERPALPAPQTGEFYTHAHGITPIVSVGNVQVEIARFTAPADAVVLAAGLTAVGTVGDLAEFELQDDTGRRIGMVFVSVPGTQLVRTSCSIVRGRVVEGSTSRLGVTALYRR
ncbi:MAG: hypothetical protein ACRENJ_06255 [Candidatus Eiseniibacteriota bacterium]